MFTRSCTRSILGASAVLSLVATAAANTVAAGDAPQRDRVRPTAGAPYYLHFGPWGGLCARSFDWSVGEGQVVQDEAAKVLYVRGRSDAETFVDIARDDMNTSTAWDDDLVVTMTIYADGPDSVETFTFPYFDTSGSGGSGGYTTSNEPKDTSVGFIFYRGSSSEKNALSNDTSMPMRADGWFSVLASGDDGFTGGNGPDCVKGSNNNDRVSTRGGADYVRGMYGDDLVHLGNGNDTVEGGADHDTMRGEGGNDLLRGDTGSDCYDGGEASDVLEDTTQFFADLDQYTTDATSNDYITYEWPMMVNACM